MLISFYNFFGLLPLYIPHIRGQSQSFFVFSRFVFFLEALDFSTIFRKLSELFPFDFLNSIFDGGDELLHGGHGNKHGKHGCFLSVLTLFHGGLT